MIATIPLHVRLVAHQPVPVLSPLSSIRYGFEGGRVIKQDGTYHLFTTEQVDDPFAVATVLAHWESTDQTYWRRVATLATSSSDFTGNDPRAALWSPLPVYDDAAEQWHLFYIAYRAEPGVNRTNHDGRVWHARSAVRGRGGIGGPYEDVGVVLEPGPQSDPWEGLQGTDSFFPYRVGDHWYAFYGSAHNEQEPRATWRVGLAEAPILQGPWVRCSALNPLPLEPYFIENPIVTPLPDNSYLAMYDTGINDPSALGWAWSPDGVVWQRGEPLHVPTSTTGGWVEQIRTPLGLVLEADELATVFYTGYQRTPSGESGTSPWGVAHVGVATVQLEFAAQPIE